MLQTPLADRLLLSLQRPCAPLAVVLPSVRDHSCGGATPCLCPACCAQLQVKGPTPPPQQQQHQHQQPSAHDQFAQLPPVVRTCLIELAHLCCADGGGAPSDAALALPSSMGGAAAQHEGLAAGQLKLLPQTGSGAAALGLTLSALPPPQQQHHHLSQSHHHPQQQQQQQVIMLPPEWAGGGGLQLQHAQHTQQVLLNGQLVNLVTGPAAGGGGGGGHHALHLSGLPR